MKSEWFCIMFIILSFSPFSTPSLNLLNLKNKLKIIRFNIEFDVNFFIDLVKRCALYTCVECIVLCFNLAFADHTFAKPKHQIVINKRIFCIVKLYAWHNAISILGELHLFPDIRFWLIVLFHFQSNTWNVKQTKWFRLIFKRTLRSAWTFPIKKGNVSH